MSVPPAFLSQSYVRKSFSFAGSVLLIYDYFLTLPTEVTYIWDAPWTMVKALFLLSRYGNLIGQTFIMLEETGYLSHGSQKFCDAFQIFTIVFAVFSTELIRFLVVVRACAILNIQSKVSIPLRALYVVYAITMLVVSLYLSETSPAFPTPYLNQTGICFSPVSFNTWIISVVVLVLDSIIFAVVFTRLFKLIRPSDGARPTRLIRLLARDAILFYATAVFNITSAFVCTTLYGQDPRVFILEAFAGPILSIVGQRLVLDLRRVYAGTESTFDTSQEPGRNIPASLGPPVWYHSYLEGSTSATQTSDFLTDYDGHASENGRRREVYELRSLSITDVEARGT